MASWVLELKVSAGLLLYKVKDTKRAEQVQMYGSPVVLCVECLHPRHTCAMMPGERWCFEARWTAEKNPKAVLPVFRQSTPCWWENALLGVLLPFQLCLACVMCVYRYNTCMREGRKADAYAGCLSLHPQLSDSASVPNWAALGIRCPLADPLTVMWVPGIQTPALMLLQHDYFWWQSSICYDYF